MKKPTVIQAKDLKKIIRETIKKTLNENNFGVDAEGIVEYFWLKPKFSGLNVDVFVDDGFAYERNGGSLVLLVRNGYDRSVDEFIVFLVSETPTILNPEIEYRITYNDIFAIQDFIVENLVPLKLLANEEISHELFLKNLNMPHYMIAENRSMLLEMATLRAKDSDLPMDIWLDEGATYQGHAPRLKFRASHEQKTTREYSSMLLTNPPTIENFPKNSPIKAKDLDTLKKFVVDNLENLLKLANGEIDYATDFLPNIKK